MHPLYGWVLSSCVNFEAKGTAFIALGKHALLLHFNTSKVESNDDAANVIIAATPISFICQLLGSSLGILHAYKASLKYGLIACEGLMSITLMSLIH